MTLLASILPAARRASPWMFFIRRPQGMSFITFAVLATFAYRTLNGKGILGRALSGAGHSGTPAKRVSRRKTPEAP